MVVIDPALSVSRDPPFRRQLEQTETNEEVSVDYYNFIPILSQKGNFQVSYKSVRSRDRSRRKYFRLHNTEKMSC